MSNTEQKQYKAILESKDAELTGRLENRDGIAIEKAADPLDEIQSAAARELATRNLHRESNLLRNVRSALTRIAERTAPVFVAKRKLGGGDCPPCRGPLTSSNARAKPTVHELFAVMGAIVCMDAPQS